MFNKLKIIFSFLTLLLFSTATLAADKVITFLHGETDTESVVAYEKIARDFEKLNPGIKIEISTVSSKDRLKKVTAMGMARKLPTVFKLNPEERRFYSDKNWVTPLDDIATGEMGKGQLGPYLVKTKGKVIDLPYTVNHFSVMWYRKDLLDAAGVKPPKTWEEWEKQAKMFTKGSGDSKQYGTMIPAGKNRYTSMFLTMMMWGAGGSYFDKDYNVKRNIWSDKINIKSTKWIIFNPTIFKGNNYEKLKEGEILELNTNFNYEKIQNLFSDLYSLSLIELLNLKKNYELLNYSTTEINLHLLKLFSYPFYLILMTILSSVIMLNIRNYDSSTFKISLGLFLSVLIYYMNNFSNILGKIGKLPLSLSIIFPLIIIMTINGIMLIKINDK